MLLLLLRVLNVNFFRRGIVNRTWTQFITTGVLDNEITVNSIFVLIVYHLSLSFDFLMKKSNQSVLVLLQSYKIVLFCHQLLEKKKKTVCRRNWRKRVKLVRRRFCCRCINITTEVLGGQRKKIELDWIIEIIRMRCVGPTLSDAMTGGAGTVSAEVSE